MIIDLHVHSYYSPDGKLTIPELLDHYSPGDIVGIADHETIGGWDEFKIESEKRGIRPVFGIEWFAGKHHVLSYFLNGVSDSFKDYMTKRRNKEKKCMRQIYNIFKSQYIDLPRYNELLMKVSHPEKILSVTVLADAISTVSGKEFKNAVYMIRAERGKLPENQKQETFLVNEIITKIKEWNAVSILAHPYYEKYSLLNSHDVEDKIRLISQYGLSGIEVISGGRNDKTKKHLLTLCDELNLLASIGSDFHYNDKGLNPKKLNDIDKDVIRKMRRWLGSRIL